MVSYFHYAGRQALRAARSTNGKARASAGRKASAASARAEYPTRKGNEWPKERLYPLLYIVSVCVRSVPVMQGRDVVAKRTVMQCAQGRYMAMIQ